MANLSLEAASRLHEKLRLKIPEYEKSADICAAILKSIKRRKETNYIALKGILRTQLMLCYINLDLCSAYRQYLSTDMSTNYENRQAMTKINVVMSEGYKKIYGFGESQHKKSFWVSQIKVAVDCFDALADEYNRIEGLLKDMANDNVLNKEMRDLTIHYDGDPLRVYNMLLDLSAEEVISRCNKFFEILAEVTKFVWTLIYHIKPTLAIAE